MLDVPLLHSWPLLLSVESELTDSARRFSFKTTDLSKEELPELAETDRLLTNFGLPSTWILFSASGVLDPEDLLGSNHFSYRSSRGCLDLALLTGRTGL